MRAGRGGELPLFGLKIVEGGGYQRLAYRVVAGYDFNGSPYFVLVAKLKALE